MVAALVIGMGVLADPRPLHLVAAAALIASGSFRFWKPRAHPRWTTMRVTRGELTWWSFLMSSAHGAGLMVAPVLLGAGAEEAHAHGGPCTTSRPGRWVFTRRPSPSPSTSARCWWSWPPSRWWSTRRPA